MSARDTRRDPAKILAGLEHAARASGNHRLLEAAGALEAAFEALTLEQRHEAGRFAVAAAHVESEVERTQTIARVVTALHSSLELDVVLQRVLDTAVDALHAQRGFLMIADDAGRLSLAALHGVDRMSLESAESRAMQVAAERVFTSGETVATTSLRGDSHDGGALSAERFDSICLPLITEARRIGVLYLDSGATSELFSPQDVNLLGALSNHAALAIHNARLFNEQRARLDEVMELEELQAKILGSVTSGVITIDAAGTITTFNQGASQTLGVPAVSMIGRPVAVLEGLIPRLSALLQTSDFSGKPLEVKAIHPTRGSLTLQIRIAPLDLGDSERRAKYRLAIAITDLTERRALETLHRTDVEQRRAIGDAFSRYLAPHVVESLMKAPSAVELGGERRTATILFADIRDFTKMAARLEAERVVEILNAYFEAAVGVLFENDGLLDKFYGDGLMAVFGPPRVRADDAARALISAARLHQVVRELEPVIREPLRISVGLATGDVVAGHIGSTRRLDYTVIGDAVNLASRLQSAAPPAATYCDETTYLRSGLHLPGERLQAKIKGRDDLVTVYRLT